MSLCDLCGITLMLGMALAAVSWVSLFFIAVTIDTEEP